MTENIDLNSPQIQPIFGPNYVQLYGVDSKKIFLDELAASDLVALVAAANANQPTLNPPINLVANPNEMVTALQVATANKNNEMMKKMLDAWQASVVENGVRLKDAQEKRERYNEVHDVFKTNGGDNAASLTTGLIFFVMGGIATTVAIAPSTAAVTASPVFNVITNAVPLIDTTLRSSLAIMGAAVATTSLYKIAANVFKGPGEVRDGKTINKAFAESYGKNILEAVKQNNIPAFAARLVKGTISNELILQLGNTVKIALLSSAIALLYVTEVNRMTDIEFGAVLRGEVEYDPHSTMGELITALRDAIDEIPAREDKVRILMALFNYFGSDPTIESLSKPGKVIASLNEEIHRGDIGG